MDDDQTPGRDAPVTESGSDFASLVSRLVEELATARERAARAETVNEELKRRMSTLRFESWKLRDELKKIAPHLEATVPQHETGAGVAETAPGPEPPVFSDEDEGAPFEDEPAMAPNPLVRDAPPPPDLWSQDASDEGSAEDKAGEKPKRWWRRV